MEQYWQELQQQVHRKAALERKQDALREQRRKLKEELDTATQRWQEEQKDVDKLEGISLAAFSFAGLRNQVSESTGRKSSRIGSHGTGYGTFAAAKGNWKAGS